MKISNDLLVEAQKFVDTKDVDYLVTIMPYCGCGCGYGCGGTVGMD